MNDFMPLRDAVVDSDQTLQITLLRLSLDTLMRYARFCREIDSGPFNGERKSKQASVHTGVPEVEM